MPTVKPTHYLPKNPDPCQINLQLFFAPRKTARFGLFSPASCPAANAACGQAGSAIILANVHPHLHARTPRTVPSASPSPHEKTQTIDRLHAIRSNLVRSNLFPATARGWSGPGRPASAAGPVWDWPPSAPPVSRRTSGQSDWVFRPALTMCVRAVAAGVAGAGRAGRIRRRDRLAPAGRKPKVEPRAAPAMPRRVDSSGFAGGAA